MAEYLPQKPRENRKTEYYKSQAESLISKNGLTFNDYLERYPELLRLASVGDELMENKESTGYNLLAEPKDMDILSNKNLLFFNMYSGDVSGISLLISYLEEKRLITESQVKLGTKASKALYDDWPLSPNEIVQNLYPNGEEMRHNPKISKTLETVLTFFPIGGDHARQIFESIREYLSWMYPDVRATISLEKNLPKTIFVPVQANILSADTRQIIALRKRTKLESEWQNKNVLVNKELASYLIMGGVKP